MKRKVVYNACYGGFGLSHEAILLLAKKKGIDLKYHESGWSRLYELQNGEYFDVDDFDRHDKELVEVVEELGEKANGGYASLQIEEVEGPYHIDEYDGIERVETPSSYDWK